jgi:hypothetical protein
MHPATGLRADYQLYIRRAKLGESMSSQPLINRHGSGPIANIDAGGKVSFRTDSAAANILVLQPGYHWKKTGTYDSVNDKLEGIWIRIFQGNTMIAEYLSEQSFRKGGWPVDPKAGATGK